MNGFANKYSDSLLGYKLLYCRARKLVRGTVIYGYYCGMEPDGRYMVLTKRDPKKKSSEFIEEPVLPSSIERLCPFPDKDDTDLFENDTVNYKGFAVNVEYNYKRHVWVLVKLGKDFKDLEESDREWIRLAR